MNSKKVTKQNNVSCPENNDLEGRYANSFKIGCNDSEFVFDFAQIFSEINDDTFHTRIITCHKYAKSFYKLFKKAIEQNENQIRPPTPQNESYD